MMLQVELKLAGVSRTTRTGRCMQRLVALNNLTLPKHVRSDQQPPMPAAGVACLQEAAGALDCSQLPHAFELKSGSVCLWGLDLPELLPQAAARPAPLVLPSALLSGVAPHRNVGQVLLSLLPDSPSHRQEQGSTVAGHAAAAANQQAAAGRGCPALSADQGVPASGQLPPAAPAPQQRVAARVTAEQLRALRWCLKRAIRAAFELTLQSQQAYSRDVFWCASLAAKQLPKLEPLLTQTAVLYMQPVSSLSELEAGARVGLRLWSAVMAVFDEQMVQVDPTWAYLSHHAVTVGPCLVAAGIQHAAKTTYRSEFARCPQRPRPDGFKAVQQVTAARLGLLKFEDPVGQAPPHFKGRLDKPPLCCKLLRMGVC